MDTSTAFGDNNPNDGQHGTFFQVLPTPRIYARFPFYNLMNNQDAFAEVVLRPHPKWTIRSDAHFLRLGNRMTFGTRAEGLSTFHLRFCRSPEQRKPESGQCLRR